MKILFAASEDAWGGFLHRIRAMVPEHDFVATGGFHIPDLSGIDVLIPTMSDVTALTLETADQLRLIQQCGSGLEKVDINAARSRGIQVANVPTGVSGNADSVAELAIYMMIGLSRHAEQMKQSLANRKMGQPMGFALKGRTAGIVGLGGIGQALVNRLKPFGMRLIGIKQSDPEEARERLGMDWVGTSSDLDRLLGESDYVILCLPVTAGSLGLIGRDQLARMKPDAFLINVSRGGIIDQDALTKALEDKIIAGAGLDVFREEPPDPSDPLFRCNVMATPHIAGSTDVSMQGIADTVAANIRRIAAGHEALHQFENHG